MFKEILNDLMNERNLSRSKFSDESGIPYGTVTGWLNKNRLPDYDALIKIADFFGCSVDRIMGRQDEYGNLAYENKLLRDEQNLLNNYRRLSADNKEIVSKLLDSLS